jgi:hypothetical protein
MKRDWRRPVSFYFIYYFCRIHVSCLFAFRGQGCFCALITCPACYERDGVLPDEGGGTGDATLDGSGGTDCVSLLSRSGHSASLNEDYERDCMKYVICIVCMAWLVLGFGVYERAGAQAYSELWGVNGEVWSPSSRLPDFSHAGYHRGEMAVPDMPIVANVKDFGAYGDGDRDDTQAFLTAIARTRDGAIFVPEGRYKITDILYIRKPNLVLRGAGAKKSILYFPEYLNDIKPNWGATTTGDRTSNYSWSGGYVWVTGNFQSSVLTAITETARRGDSRITVASTQKLSVGQEIEIYVTDTASNSLADHLYSGTPGNMDKLNGSTKASLVCTILQIDGARISVDRPLRFDLEPEWKPVVRQFKPTVSEVGIEHLGFEYPVKEYGGHFSELGYNAIALSSVANCWVRDIHIQNADSGLFVSGRFCTMDGVVFDSDRPADNTHCTGHHGIYLSSDDNLYTRFTYNTRFIHDLTVSHCAGNVCSHGSGVDLCFDHHKRAPYENLFTDIDLGVGTRMWRCGGGADLGMHCAARGTFWNIRAERFLSYPSNFGPPSMNLVGLHARGRSHTNMDGIWYELIAPEVLEPKNLHEAQLNRRLGQSKVDWLQFNP